MATILGLMTDQRWLTSQSETYVRLNRCKEARIAYRVTEDVRGRFATLEGQWKASKGKQIFEASCLRTFSSSSETAQWSKARLIDWLRRAGWGAVSHRIGTWSDQKMNRVCRNPFSLYWMRLLPFGAADALHRLAGGTRTDARRIQAGVQSVLKEQVTQGHIGVSLERLTVLLGDRLCVDSEELRSLSFYLHPKVAVEQDGQIVLAEVVRQLSQVDRCLATNQMQMTNYVDPRLAELLSYTYTVVTGPAGSGKTELLRRAVTACQADGLRVAVTATTGKAASLLGRVAQTVHRLLKYGPHGFSRRVLPHDVVFVDEASMLTLPVLVALLRVVRGAVIFSGDPRQLPPVHGISVFGYLLKHLPVLALDKVATTWGEIASVPVDTFCHDSTESVLDHLDREVQACRGGGKSVQVLSPVKESPLGTQHLNRWLQTKLNPDGAVVTSRLRIGDPIIVQRNAYDLPVPVFNGQTGVVTGLQEGRVVMRLDVGGEAFVPESNLELAYCLTVHKAQGSRFPVVIFVIPEHSHRSFTRDQRLQYVGRTRGLERTVCLVH
ncbi:MAG: ATP-dependent RecD-like DNA helicase [Nitrospirales bacterium]|nr:MAG: ATP-dependent RecD-like DNA helicase [Nitrospirales bacterium]